MFIDRDQRPAEKLCPKLFQGSDDQCAEVIRQNVVRPDLDDTRTAGLRGSQNCAKVQIVRKLNIVVGIGLGKDVAVGGAGIAEG